MCPVEDSKLSTVRDSLRLCAGSGVTMVAFGSLASTNRDDSRISAVGSMDPVALVLAVVGVLVAGASGWYLVTVASCCALPVLLCLLVMLCLLCLLSSSP